MTVYFGTVKDKVIVLPEDVELANGLQVEVHILEPQKVQANITHPETAFLQRLVDLGLLETIKTPDRSQADQDRTLIEVKGTPLSETIIEERR